MTYIIAFISIALSCNARMLAIEPLQKGKPVITSSVVKHNTDTSKVAMRRQLSTQDKELMQKLRDLIKNTPGDISDIKHALGKIAASNEIIVKNNDITLQRARETRDAFDGFRIVSERKLDSLTQYAKRAELAKQEATEYQRIQFRTNDRIVMICFAGISLIFILNFLLGFYLKRKLDNIGVGTF